MSRRKNDVVVENDSEDAVLIRVLSGEAMRLMDDHRETFHKIEKKDCKICRSFRRTILGGLSK